MKSYRNRILFTTTAVALAAACATAIYVHADVAPWMQSVVSGSAIEAALYRAMDFPGIRSLYPRPPAEARNQLNALVVAKPGDAQLYALRAHVDEQALDFTAAEQDWKSFVAHAQDKTAAQIELADFYHRRNNGPQEIASLEASAAAPSSTTERFVAANNQPAWQAFSRALTVAHDQALGDDSAIAIYKAWIARYPTEPAVHANYISALLKMRRYGEVQQAIIDYKTAFPQDQVFPIKASALLAFDQGSADATVEALALFNRSYQPLWPSDLVSTYFELLNATHTQHAMLIATRAQLLQNPDDLAAATKIFHYYQQQGRSDAAINVLVEYGSSKDTRHVPWSADELYTFATLLDRDAQYQEAARYYFALASNTGKPTTTTQSAEEAGLAGLIHILLTAPDQPIALGSGNLSLYRDLATLDRGPGYLNGILSLWLNSEDPASEFHDDEQKARPYFHREKAAELLAVLDQHFPASPNRPALHASLIQAYVGYGQDEAVKQAGQRFLADFPQALQHLEVALEVADADARTNDTPSEFALYDSLLTELARTLQGMPLTAAGPAAPNYFAPIPPVTDEDTGVHAPAGPVASALLQQFLTVPVTPPPTTAAAVAYREVLDRYLGRLVMTNQPLVALAVLRRELDRNPDDPLLYERLADFLQQNNLTRQEEQVYQRAIFRFNNTTFYDKLARFYLRQRRSQDFSSLTRKVVDIFQGTDLEQYFANVNGVWPQEYLQLNLYAHQRFPHDLVFTRNLLSAYRAQATADPRARERLLREHWQEAPDLQAEFFDELSRTHQLSTELAALEALIPSDSQRQQNPDAARELAEIHLWQSHFEQSAPLLGALAQAYPADLPIGEEAASVFRSLAYFDPKQIAHAVEVRKHLSDADPTSLDRLATIGDTYADSTATSLNLDVAQQLTQAAPFWRRMASVHPGIADGYLQSATVFWDYFQFDDALAQIEAARTQFKNPALYGYQAGAIYENKRDYPRAIAEYVAAATASGETSNSDAHSRLLELASRAQFTDLVDQASANAVAQRSSLAALQLRADVLNTLHQRASISPVVEAAIAHASTIDALADLAAFSQEHQLPHACQSALQREISLTSDPVQHIELQYQLAHSYQDAGDIAAAQRIIESVYNDSSNSRLVGVVRTTIDFYWNNKQPQRAIATLVQASQKANAGLAHDFTLEAIAKSNQSGDFSGARTLLKPLLADDPFNAQYLGLQAESFSLAHDDSGLRDFYASTIDALKSAPLNAIDRRDKIAFSRQGMIPALTGLKDFGGAMDQHIALISAFPEDGNILQAATSYARLHSRETQLVTFLNKAVAESPRDSRFAIDLGRVDVQFEDYAGALAAYSKAISIRSDRPDLYIARADLEEHQQSFDAACADYDRLYLLTYKDPQWMEKAALARARQGKAELAVKALQTAWLDGHNATAADYFRVAEQLEQWNLLPQADTFAAQGVKLAGNDLLAERANSAGAVFYARLLARERRAPEALSLLTQMLQASNASPSSPAVIIQQVEKRGLAEVTDSEWRVHLVQARRQQAESTFRSALQQIFSVVGEFYTPEEKSSIAALLDAKHAAGTMQETVYLWIPAASAAGLKDREAEWRRDVLLHGGLLASSQLSAFNTLENERMDYAPLAETLDTYAQQVRPVEQPGVLSMAATAWRNAGNRQREVLDLRKLVIGERQQQFEQRLFEIYLHGDTSALLQLTTSNSDIADAAANYLLANGTQAQTYTAIANRASMRRPVWESATSALVGLYFGDTSPETDSNFQRALANDLIGQRLQSKPDESRQLIGAPWFYYGTRYGFFLTLLSKPRHDAEDYLPAELELAPNNAASYYALARVYLDTRKVDAAIVEYRHVIEINPSDPSANIAIAEALWSDGRHDAALTEWNEAFIKLRAMVDLHSVPEVFWTSFATIARDASNYQLGTQLKPAMDVVLQAYIRKNGNYRSMELLHSAYITLEKQNSEEAINWVLSLVADMPANDELNALSDLVHQYWLPRSQFDGIYRREIALAQTQIQAAPSRLAINDSDDYSSTRLTAIQTEYIKWLLQNDRAADAQRIFDSIKLLKRQSEELQTIVVLLAAKQSRIPSLLADYTSDPSSAPSLAALSTAANTLRLQHDFSNSRLLLEYVFQQKLQQQGLSAPDYLALAEARIATGDLPGALDLLNRLTLQGDLYENLDSATALLVRTGHSAEALPMLKTLANGAPWRADYLLRLGQAQLALKQSTDAAVSLSTVTSSDQASYAIRATAADALRALPPSRQFSSAELTLLATITPTPQQAGQPYFVYARIAATASVTPPQCVALLRAAIQIAPASMLDWLRVRLFQAEIAQGHYEQAQIAIDPFLRAHPSLRFLGSNDNAGENFIANAEVTVEPTSAPYTTSVLASPEDQRTFVLSLASMDEHLGNEQQAINELQSAIRLTPDTTQRPRLDLRIKALQHRLAIAQENASRRPIISGSIEQTALVRPRITTATAEVQP